MQYVYTLIFMRKIPAVRLRPVPLEHISPRPPPPPPTCCQTFRRSKDGGSVCQCRVKLCCCFVFFASPPPPKNRIFVTFRLTATLARVFWFRTRNKVRIFLKKKKAAGLDHAEGRTRGGRRSSGLDRPNPPRISVEVDGSCGLTLRPQPVCCDCGCCHWRSSASTAANGLTAN